MFKIRSKTLCLNIVLSIVLLLFLLCFELIKPNNIINDSITNNNITLIKVPYYFTKLYSNQKIIDDQLVSEKMIYDDITFDGITNHIISASFNGVYNFTDGIVIKITKNKDSCYSITVQDVNGFLYEYNNLKSVEINIYSFVKSQTILGESSYDSNTSKYFCDVKIYKKGVYYNFYELEKN